MRKYLKYTFIVIVLIVVSNGVLFWYMNRIPPQLKEPNYFTYYKNQDLIRYLGYKKIYVQKACIFFYLINHLVLCSF